MAHQKLRLVKRCKSTLPPIPLQITPRSLPPPISEQPPRLLAPRDRLFIRPLQTWKDREHENLRVKLLHRLLDDELRRRAGQGSPRARGFRERLEEAIAAYHNRMITAAQVVQEMIAIRKATEAEKAEALALGLSVEELRFYEVVRAAYPDVWGEAVLRDVIHEVVQTVRRNLKVDWTAAHRRDVRASVVSAVKRVLFRKGVAAEADREAIAQLVVRQAEERWRNWPEAA